MLRFLLSIPTIPELFERLCLYTLASRYILFLFIILFPPFTALYGSATTFVAVLVDVVFHCRMYTCGG